METICGTFTEGSRKRIEVLLDWELLQLKYFVWLARHTSATRMLDVGANVGAYSVTAAAYCPDLERIDAFEPAPVAFDELCQNLVLQPDRQRFTAHRVAAAATAGTGRFRVYGDMHGANRLASARPANERDVETIEVELVPLDSLVDSSGETLMMKIDVEGAELDVLAGARRVFDDNRCLLQIETLDEHGTSEVEALLRGYGYVRVLHFRDDHYFAPADDEKLRQEMVERAFDDLTGPLNELRDLHLGQRQLARALRIVRRERGLLDLSMREYKPEHFAGFES